MEFREFCRTFWKTENLSPLFLPPQDYPIHGGQKPLVIALRYSCTCMLQSYPLSSLRCNHLLLFVPVFFASRLSQSPMAPPKVVAEYAKSGRSSCKGCSKAISNGALRLGSSSKDTRGFDLVKWFHVDCFPSASRSLPVAAEIVGFSSLKVGWLWTRQCG